MDMLMKRSQTDPNPSGEIGSAASVRPASQGEVVMDINTPATSDASLTPKDLQATVDPSVEPVPQTQQLGDSKHGASRSGTPSGIRKNLSGHAGQMWNAFVHHVPHPHWRSASPTTRRRPVDDRRMKSSFQEAAGHEAAGHDVPPLAFTGKFCGGIRADIKRRAPWYWDDWLEALRPENRSKAMASCIFLFFACLSPAVTFGMLFQDGTGGQLGVVEMIISSGISGIIYALLSGQPLCILGATGPELAYTVVFYKMCLALDLEFLPARVWEGLWTALFTILLATFDLSALMRRVTRFTEEIFSALISIIFIVGALQNIVYLFVDDATILGRARAFMATVFCFGTYQLATACKNTRKSLYFTPMVRNILANYGVTIAIVVFTALATLVFPDVGIPTLDIPTKLAPTYDDPVLGRKRDWLVNPFGTHKAFPVWGIFFTILPALGLTILGYLDQNLTSLLINRKDHNLRKPPGYHLDLLVCGVFIYPICSFFGLPFTHAATVRSMTHLISLSTRETIKLEGGGTSSKVKHVIEGRTTHMIIHVLLLLSVALAPALKLVPKAVLYGVFLFMGIGSMAGNQLFDRAELLFIWNSSAFPKYPYVKNVKVGAIHKFTVFQIFCFGLVYGMMRIDAISVGFPFMIGLLIFVRMGMSKFWTQDQLRYLDE